MRNLYNVKKVDYVWQLQYNSVDTVFVQPPQTVCAEYVVHPPKFRRFPHVFDVHKGHEYEILPEIRCTTVDLVYLFRLNGLLSFFQTCEQHTVLRNQAAFTYYCKY